MNDALNVKPEICKLDRSLLTQQNVETHVAEVTWEIDIINFFCEVDFQPGHLKMFLGDFLHSMSKFVEDRHNSS